MKNCNYVFSVHSEYTLRRHSRGPSIHFRPSRLLFYNAGGIHEHATQPPPNTSAIRDHGRCPHFQPQRGNVEKQRFCLKPLRDVWYRLTAANAGVSSGGRKPGQVSRPAGEIRTCRKHTRVVFLFLTHIELGLFPSSFWSFLNICSCITPDG